MLPDVEVQELDRLIFPEAWREQETPRISAIMRSSFTSSLPPFFEAWYGDRYRTFSLSLEWLAGSFVANAEKEAEGARKLWRIAGEARNTGFADAIARHAADEARHARMYMAMLALVFPGALDEEDEKALLASFPTYGNDNSPPGDVESRPLSSLIDDLVQMNIGEIRTRVHQMLLRPVAMAVALPRNRRKLDALLKRIYEDEGSHIIYTAEILERCADETGDDQLKACYVRRLADFGQITLEEVGVGQFD